MTERTQHNFKKLDIWICSKNLVKDIYTLCKELPDTEKFGLISQMCRSAVSIPSNIAEGSKRGSKKDFIQFLRIAEGSCAELETQLILAAEIYAIDTKNSQDNLRKIENMIYRFRENFLQVPMIANGS